ncbi:hypothetical protein E5082_30035 [Streptomyces griseoluteus]|uniref:Uncharacterized protein n=1 Tax=Streptomyces griseoluteus TaxID=29306 RepID=A0A4Z1CZ55_STRGP|nr:hypothetical protein [Streptomyces griseoluteus]TGN74353.1 hypothetical protein E5082_30035 [Streptomyces griseoluteus]
MTLLSRRRGAELPAARWDAGPWRNTPIAASYTSSITAPGERRALSTAAMLAVQDGTVVTCADVLLEDTAAWAAVLPDGAGTQLGLDEVQALLLAAWETAAETLPDAVADPARMRWCAPPTTELWLRAEGPHDRPSPGLGALIDLEALDPGEDGIRPEMAVTITASPTMHRQERRAVLRRALVHMARHFGHCGPRKNCCRGGGDAGAVVSSSGPVARLARCFYVRPGPWKCCRWAADSCWAWSWVAGR